MHHDIHAFRQQLNLIGVECARGCVSTSLVASPPITTLPAGVSTR